MPNDQEFDTIIAKGLEFQQRKNLAAETRRPNAEMWAQKHGRKVDRQIEIAAQRLKRIEKFLVRFTGKPVSASINRDRRFPVVIDTGFTINQPNYFGLGNIVVYSGSCSPVTVKARGNKLILQAGTKEVFGSSCVHLKDRIVARGERAILRYLARNFSPA